ncbi:hypothetical protein DL771_003561 [Monosporascus sp. 5C6A]|nr:hypothetical protein DL771_003561 [Monosporascus sp. 5C6A]
MGPAGVTPNLSLFESLADYGKVDIWFVLPQYVNELGQAPEILPKLRSSKLMAVAGEGFLTGNLLVNRDDFLYFAFHPYSGFDFREVEPGVYEHWVVRNEKWSLFQGIFHTFPGAQEINLKDLYVKHPTKPDHWLYWGRSDDIIALADGIKISPSDVQATISAHPSVNECLMVGTGQKFPALLVELNDPKPSDPAALEQLLASIQMQIQKADNSSLYKGYLHNDCIILADPKRPFVRTDKLTVKRQQTLALYQQDIERFYVSRGDEAGWALASSDVDRFSTGSGIP